MKFHRNENRLIGNLEGDREITLPTREYRQGIFYYDDTTQFPSIVEPNYDNSSNRFKRNYLEMMNMSVPASRVRVNPSSNFQGVISVIQHLQEEEDNDQPDLPPDWSLS